MSLTGISFVFTVLVRDLARYECRQESGSGVGIEPIAKTQFD